ncbi:MAG: CBS domain-containing protein [Sinobacteraceae bacterium]|nr:CBS domain-containing protein [Nevskiaceae bacterium]MBV8853867.1 CBS domain-containing protein [Nevskiaceae bacterium]MBV9913009.1 CBS domain-containing protein [Nevskiaceae bacterium]
MTTVRHLLEHKGKALYSVQAEDPVLDAIRVMADRHVGALVVMKGNTLQGIVSERDYARKVILKGRSSADTPVAHIMSSPATTVTPQQTVQECMKLMTEGRFRHLPVVEAGAVIGMISIGDIVRALMEEQQQTIEQLENYIHR